MVPNTRSKSQIAIRFLCGFAPLREKRTKIVRSTKYNVPSRGYEVNGAKYKKQEPKERLDSFAACLPPGRLGAFASKKKKEPRYPPRRASEKQDEILIRRQD